MKCEKCSSKIIDGSCIKCGYLVTGEQIEEKIMNIRLKVQILHF